VTKTFAVKLEVGLDIMHLDPHTDNHLSAVTSLIDDCRRKAENVY